MNADSQFGNNKFPSLSRQGWIHTTPRNQQTEHMNSTSKDTIENESETLTGATVKISYLKNETESTDQATLPTADSGGGKGEIAPLDARGRQTSPPDVAVSGEHLPPLTVTSEWHVDAGANHGPEGFAVSEQVIGAVERSEQLKAEEEIIRRGAKAFVEMGNALARIRDRKLYLPEFASFEAYVEAKFDFTKQRASQLIIASDRHRILADRVDPEKLPSTERGMRALMQVPEDQMVAVLEEAGKDGDPSAEKISKAREKIVPPKSSKAPKAKVMKWSDALSLGKKWATLLAACKPEAITSEESQELKLVFADIEGSLRGRALVD
jgi:hypothetical protein